MTDVRTPVRDRRETLTQALAAALTASAVARRSGDAVDAEARWTDAERIGLALDRLDAADEWAILADNRRG